MITRRHVLASTALLAGCGRTGAGSAPFISVEGMGFSAGGAPYRYAGANIWYGAYLGADTDFGNRDRLRRELDTLAGLGIDNLRVLGSGEISPLRNSLNPAFRDKESYNEALLVGLDFLLAEMAERGMRAVIYLTNFWEWSGGMATYLYWTNGGTFVDMNDPAHPWPAFPNATSAFYGKADAVALYHDYVRAIVSRTNTVTGGAYKDDPTIMSWQLCNEPRPAGDETTARQHFPAFYAWINDTAALIKSLDANHLVSTGSEGLKGCVELPECVVQAHSAPQIDYVTAHIWPQNWSWVNPQDIPGTIENAERLTHEYITQHVGYAQQVGKPLVIEEFGFPRDGALYTPGSPTTFKDRFYGVIYEAAEASKAGNGPLAGTNFWAWGGAGRAAHEDLRWRTGDTTYVGDPPHEPQGWYSVFDNDESTLALIRAHAAVMKAA